MEEKRNPPKLRLLIYGHLVSQPVRAVLGFCQKNGIKFDFKETSPFTGATKTKEYAKISPMKLIPAI